MNGRRLRLALKPSPLLATAIVAAHAAAAACAALLLPALPGALILVALLVLGALAACRAALLLSPSAVRTLEIEGTKITLTLANGASLAAEIAERRYVHRFMVVVLVRRPARRAILITRDMLPGDSFRLLRVWALWGRVPVAAAQLPA